MLRSDTSSHLGVAIGHMTCLCGVDIVLGFGAGFPVEVHLSDGSGEGFEVIYLVETTEDDTHAIELADLNDDTWVEQTSALVHVPH